MPEPILEVSQTKVDIDGNDLAQAQQRLSLLQAGARPEEVQKAQAALAASKLGLQSDQQAYALLKIGSRPEVIQQAADDVAQAQIAAQHQDLVFARRHVYAPMAGIVVERNVNPGEIASSSAGHLDANAPLGTPAKGMFVIAADDSVEFMASVDQRFYRSVRPGQPASVSIEVYPGRAFAGRISRLKPLINPQLGMHNGALPLTFAMWVRVPNPDHALIFGQTGLITVNSKQSGLVVPQAALNSFTLGKGVVYTVADGVVHARPVRYDGTSDGTVRILSGLRLGDKVVVSDTSKLVGGQKSARWPPTRMITARSPCKTARTGAQAAPALPASIPYSCKETPSHAVAVLPRVFHCSARARKRPAHLPPGPARRCRIAGGVGRDEVVASGQ